MSRIPFNKNSTTSTTRALDLVYTNVCGPMQTVAPGGKRYILTLVDDFSCRV